ncbi:unnamed protein product [Calicophoron daubneyi]|uniref:Midasin n=1 Tax=Calicophoron daubneyi TaxID=300641 RepID=A0AAV2TE23_CALDB
MSHESPVADPHIYYISNELQEAIWNCCKALERRDPVLICGPVGCGKSSFIRLLSHKISAQTIWVQVSDQTDAKSLLGTYSCTEIPGQFAWHPGPLLTAVLQGYWFVLEDIDRGSPDLLILLSTLMRDLHSSGTSITGLINPVSGKTVDIHPEFRLFITRRMVLNPAGVGRLECDNAYTSFVDRHSYLVSLPSISKENLPLIITETFPSVKPLLERILRIYELVCDEFTKCTPSYYGNNNRAREISLRDLLKYCGRLVNLPQGSDQGELVFLNAVDCFMACLSDPTRQFSLATQIAGELNLSVEKVGYFLHRRPIKLDIKAETGVLQLGRARLKCHRTVEWEVQLTSGSALNQSSDTISWPFASTRLALTLLERLAVAVAHHEPVLLVGETGTGKTSAVQRLAYLCGRRLRVINLNQQSDSIELMGGFKPVDTRALVRPLREQFESLFCRTFQTDSNLVFLGHINMCFNEGRWRDLISLMQHPAQMAFAHVIRKESDRASDEFKGTNTIRLGWSNFLHNLESFKKRLNMVAKMNQPALGFAFIEGALVRALQDGDWVLLDEVNLAPAEMLDCLSGLLDSDRGSITLVERGDKQPLVRHPDFHLFAAMNPSTDIGKRDLPVGLRNRFTEIYVPELDPGPEKRSDRTQENSVVAMSESADREDLAILTRAYLLALSPTPSQISTLVRLYAALKQAAREGLVDGVGQRPHFSLRTLCRALIEAGRGFHGSVLRSLYEGLIFSFGSQISRSSRPLLDTLIRRFLTLACGSSNSGRSNADNLASLLRSPLPMPKPLGIQQDGSEQSRSSSAPPSCEYLNVEGYWIPRRPEGVPRQTPPDALVDGIYVLTPAVRANLKDLARVVAAGGSLPILLQGETSVGKTSLITYLAERVGQVCYRINNHEHTDQQTYFGAYTVASATAQSGAVSAASSDDPPPLVFREGPLVQAMRAGYWIILDELNLAPTEILEALNRLLDDNRTLFIPDTQEVVKAHPQFRLFATQNPPGLYAGRKVLSRALRNRFIELHFDPLPRDELAIILEKRCQLPASRACRLVEVMRRLQTDDDDISLNMDDKGFVNVTFSQLARCHSNLFQGKESFITLRDLFRWAERYRLATCDQTTSSGSGTASGLFDWDSYLADQGYLLLAGRVRNPDEARVVAEAIEAVFKRKISESRLFDLSDETSPATAEFLKRLIPTEVDTSTRPGGFEHIVWTRDMRRLLALIGNALKYKEPVLLIGDTGCGKTTVCQLFAALQHQQLRCVNCHQYTEAADFLGGLRPVRHNSSRGIGEDDGKTSEDGRLFEWVDGPLVTAMLNGDMFLLDEISLADDAVLERLNSLLEPERKITLAERSEGANSAGTIESNEITAHRGFHLVATMNPGGDYGKKELSPALRNRFTEIWCPIPPIVRLSTRVSNLTPIDNDTDLLEPLADLRAIVEHNLLLRISSKYIDDLLSKKLAAVMVDFVIWFANLQVQEKTALFTMFNRRPQPTIRDLIAWVDFIHSVLEPEYRSADETALPHVDIFSACLHGAALIFLDALDSTAGDSKQDNEASTAGDFVRMAVDFLSQRLSAAAVETDHDPEPLRHAVGYLCCNTESTDSHLFGLKSGGTLFGAEPFFIPTGPIQSASPQFVFSAPTPAMNLRRILRALQLPQRALLLEGSPGVGKTTLVLALAKVTGHEVVRINLSEATEASDLFGCDLPVEGADAGVFAWRDGPLLQALRRGQWIVLDEMNLASQSVLECLNACLDHRGEIYIPELNSTFKVEPKSTRLFACQNPVRQGGGRKGLPKSFLNRFTQVYLQSLSNADQEFILTQLYPRISAELIRVMIAFNKLLNEQVNTASEFGTQGGGSWEFNLRDLMRWCDLIEKGENYEGTNPGLYVHLLYADRMRTSADKLKIVELWKQVCTQMDCKHFVYYHPLGRVRMCSSSLRVGIAGFETKLDSVHPVDEKATSLLLLDEHRGVLEDFLKVMEMGWMAILLGPPGSGKRTLVQIGAMLASQNLVTMALSPSADTVELLGTLEQREAGGLFSWIDSPLITGIREGHWVLIENAGLCSPSVLDRLNSLLEPGGELILNERGLDSQGNLIRLRPHRDFRLILAVDESPQLAISMNGVSRAMRNRGVEIAIPHELSALGLDLVRLLTNSGTPEGLANALVGFHSLFSKITGSYPSTEGCEFTLENTCSPPPGLAKRPPIDVLLSAGVYIKQLFKEERDRVSNVVEIFPDNDDERIAFARRTLTHVLNAVFTTRQMNEIAVSFVRDLITRFANEVHLDKCSIEYPIQPDKLPYLCHPLSELYSCAQPTSYRRYYAHLCRLALLPNLRDTRYWTIAHRLLLEQANASDCPDALHLLQCGNFLQKFSMLSELQSHACGVDMWSDWPDARWLPGWRHLSDFSVESKQGEWDRKMCQLLISELVKISFCNREVNYNSLDASNAPMSQLAVLDACLLRMSEKIPEIWFESYPGLGNVFSQWIQFLKNHLASCNSMPSSTHSRLLEACTTLGNGWIWLMLFGFQPLGDVADWPERLAFHNQRAGLDDHGEVERYPSFDLIRLVLPAPCPREVPSYHLEFSPLTASWSSFGRKISDVLSYLQNDLSCMDEDMEEDAWGENELSSTDDEALISRDIVKTVSNARLWPLALSTLLRVWATGVLPESENIRTQIRSFLALARPRLLSLLTMLHPCRQPGPAQAHALKQSNIDTIGDPLVDQFCDHLDLSSIPQTVGTVTITSGQIEQPSLTGEWRSMSQPVYALCWPTVRNFDQAVRCSGQTLLGWQSTRSALTRAHYLLLLNSASSTLSSFVSSDPLQLSPGGRSSEALCQRCHTLLGGIYQALTDSEVPVAPLQICSSTIPPDLDTQATGLSLSKWMQSDFLPQLHASQSQFGQSPEWSSLLHMTERLVTNLLIVIKHPSRITTQAACWTIFGCLCLRILCPRDPLDPFIATQVELKAVKKELERIDYEIELRRAIRKLSFDDRSHILPHPINTESNSSEEREECWSLITIQGLVEAGLEHPWLAVLMERREELIRKAWVLSEKTAVARSTVPSNRQHSNIEYSKLRRRLSAFVMGFTDKLLLSTSPHRSGDPQRILSHLDLNTVQHWTEGACDLAEWLTEPERINSFADIIEPFLKSLSDVMYGLRTLAQSALESPETLLVLELIDRLTTSLLPSDRNRMSVNGTHSDRIASKTLRLVTELTKPSVRSTIRQLASRSAKSNDEFEVCCMDFRMNSLILDLLWLHCAESAVPPLNERTTDGFIGRLLAYLVRPLAARWRRAEAERKKAAADRAALFIEAERRKRQFRDILQDRDRKDYSQTDLIDPDLEDEVDWRLRFSESVKTAAVAQMNAEQRHAGLDKADRIQQVVEKIEQVDNWLKRSLAESRKTWIPDENELIYFVKRVQGLLIPRLQWTFTEQNESASIDTPRVDASTTWRWHTLLGCYSLASWLLFQTGVSLDPAVDNRIVPVHVAVTAYLSQNDVRARACLPCLKFPVPSDEPDRYSSLSDVYQHPIPLDAANSLQSVLNSLESKVNEILATWPGQPSLVRILVLIRRLESFSISDPLIKFVTGLEMIWQEIQEWEKNAAHHVSLIEQNKRVCDLLIDCRKSELRCWLSTLDSTSSSFAERSATIWFHLHDVFLCPPRNRLATTGSEKDSITEEKERVASEVARCEVLVELMENGPIGEFYARWKLIAAIYSALDIWPGLTDEERSKSKRVVGNVVWFYAQFIPYVNKELCQLRKPIEKELKNLVRISKWGDYTHFWSVKSNVDRCKKTIHKQIRNWEVILRKPVRPLFESAVRIPDAIDLKTEQPTAQVQWFSKSPTSDNFWLSVNDCSWLSDQVKRRSDLPAPVRRLPVLVPRLNLHIRRMASVSPIIQWTRALSNGMRTWIDFITDLEADTRKLESTCPSPHLLAHLKSSTTNKKEGKNAPDAEALESARQWHQKYTALQQRKRLALWQWFRIAEANSNYTSTEFKIRENGNELTQDDDIDSNVPPADVDEGFQCDTDEQDLPEFSQLPSLGLSYRRGQRCTQTDSMTRFLSQLGGDPWNSHQLPIPSTGDHSEISLNIPEWQKASDFRLSELAYSSCRRMAHLLAMRSGLPRNPGPPNASPETVAAIITELGGPTNVIRLTGLADDLVNQCASALDACSQLTTVARELRQKAAAYECSLNERVGGGAEQTDDLLCGSFGQSGERLQEIQMNVQTIGQLTQEITYEWICYWNACATHRANSKFGIRDLEELFGSQTCDLLVKPNIADPQNLSDISDRMNNYSTKIVSLSGHIIRIVSSVVRCPSFLATGNWLKQLQSLQSPVNDFLQLLSTASDECLQGSSTASLTSAITGTVDRMASALKRINNQLDGCVLLPIYSDTLKSDKDNSPGDGSFENSVNRLIKSILSSFEALYRADRLPSENSTEIGQAVLLSHFAHSITTTCTTSLRQADALMSRCRSTLAHSGDAECEFLYHVRMIRCVFPLINGLAKSVCLRALQFWGLFDTWLRLGEHLVRVTGRLLVDGFCRPAGLSLTQTGSPESGSVSSDQQTSDGQDTEGSAGGTSLTAQGVDTSGAKDVSKELECQEQIEGLMDDVNEGSDQQNQNTDDSEGIEMPEDNFGGELDAEGPTVDGDQSDEERDLDQDITDTMGEAGETADGLSKEMWASDAEDEEENEQGDEGKESKDDKNETNSGGVQDAGDDRNPTKGDGQEKDQGGEEPKESGKDDSSDTPKESSEEADSADKRPNNLKTPADRCTVAGDDGDQEPSNEQATQPPENGQSDIKSDDQLQADLEEARLNDEKMESDNDDSGSDVSLPSAPFDPAEGSAESEMPEDEVGEGACLDAEIPEDTEEPLGESELNASDAQKPDETNDVQQSDLEAFPYHPASGDLASKGDNTDLVGSDMNNQTSDSQILPDTVDQLTSSNADKSGNSNGEAVATGSEGQGTQPTSSQEMKGSSLAKANKPRSKPRGPKPTSENRLQDPTSDSNRPKPLQGVEIMDTDQTRDSSDRPTETKQPDSGQSYKHLPASNDEPLSENDLRAQDSATEAQRQKQQPYRSDPDEDVGVEADNIDEPSTELPTSELETQSSVHALPQQTCHATDQMNGPGGDEVVEPPPNSEFVTTLGAERPMESVIGTQRELISQVSSVPELEAVMNSVELTHDRSAVPQDVSTKAASEWMACTQRSAALARQLCESLRLILEPTKAARLRGDYRTGKRINMRKIIPYLASQFRKDKIWLRRSQPSQREYRILIAVDDSSSMSDNLCRQMTFDSLATVVTALNLLEVGQVGICSFGEDVRILHNLNETWFEDAGPAVLSRFTFEQSRTSMIKLLHNAIKLMQTSISSSSTGAIPSQLLLILSDGVFSEDPQDPCLQAAVRLARDTRIFPVCLILDDVRKKHSIFDLRRYTGPGKLTPYMDAFPLPYYLVIREVTALPHLLSDALRQWFELESSFGQ